MTNAKYDELLIRYDDAAKKEAGRNQHIVEEGKRALERNGLFERKSIFSYIRAITRKLKMTACRPATRFLSVAYYYVGKQLTTNRAFEEKFYRTTVSQDQTLFNIDGKEYHLKIKGRARKSNIEKNIIELETNSDISPTKPSLYTGDSHENSDDDSFNSALNTETSPSYIPTYIDYQSDLLSIIN
jgi:hypothetical protein